MIFVLVLHKIQTAFSKSTLGGAPITSPSTYHVTVWPYHTLRNVSVLKKPITTKFKQHEASVLLISLGHFDRV